MSMVSRCRSPLSALIEHGADSACTPEDESRAPRRSSWPFVLCGVMLQLGTAGCGQDPSEDALEDAAGAPGRVRTTLDDDLFGIPGPPDPGALQPVARVPRN